MSKIDRPEMKSRTRQRSLTLLVTVGSTRFDALIERIFSEDVANLLTSLHFNRLIVQTGASDYDKRKVESIRKNHQLQIEVYDYKNSLLDDIDRADVVMGHAGAGTCLEVLRKNKRLLLVVNDTLMDNHQNELADQLSADKHVIASNIAELLVNLEKICDVETKLEEFPPNNSSKFEEIFNEALKNVTSRM